MKKNIHLTFYFFLFTFSFLLFPCSTNAFTNGFNVTSNEELITVTGQPGTTHSLTINLETSSPNLTVYPMGLDLPSENSYSQDNSWLTFTQTTLNLTNANVTTLSFSLTIPTDSTTGEYYKAVAVSDITFVDGQNTNPPTLLAVPITVQVSQTAASTTSTTTSTSTTTTTSSPTQQTASPKPQTTKKYSPKTTLKPSPKSPDIFSKIYLQKLSTTFLVYNQSTIINLYLKNEGNISTIPTGSIQVLNNKKNVIKSFSLNKSTKILKPNQTELFSFTLNHPAYLFGQFTIKVDLGDINTQTENLPTTYHLRPIYHFGTYPLIIFAIFLLLLFPLKKIPFQKLSLLLCLLGLAYFYYLSHRPENFRYLGEQINLDITANVKEQIGLRSIVNNDLSKTIMFTSTNPLGSRLYSLQDSTRTNLDQVAQYTYGSYLTNLSYPNTHFPLMMITIGY